MGMMSYIMGGIDQRVALKAAVEAGREIARENVELRVLVYDMFREFRYTAEACHWDALCGFAERMRALDMEVGDWEVDE